MPGNDDAGRTAALGDSEQRTEVAGVGDAVDGDEERRLTVHRSRKGVDIDFGQRRASRQDTLGRFAARGTLELSWRHELGRNAQLLCEVGKLT
jgi:hypothetical protein